MKTKECMIEEVCAFLNNRGGVLCVAYYDEEYMVLPQITHNGNKTEVYSFEITYKNGVESFSVEIPTIEALPAESLSKDDLKDILRFCNDIEAMESNS